MIVTGKKRVPPLWIALTILPWASFTFNGGVIGTAFVFSLRKFVENPATVTFILSLPNFFSLAISPAVSFLSDRIWTRAGRRKPFIIVSWAGMAAGLGLMPFMPNLWLLVAAFLLYQVASALNAPLEPLKQEVIPPAQRGFATGAMTWCSNLATVVFYFIMLGRFDDVSFLGGWRLTGEEVIYGSAALLLAVMLLIIVLGIRETDPHSALRGQRLSWRNILGGLLDRELRPVYLLVVSSAFLNFYAGLGPISNLLYTDQWGYTKQEMGVNVAVGGVLNIFVIGLLTVFADRLNRMRAYQTTICLLLFGNAAYYGYVNFVLPDKHPTLVEIICFGEAISMLSILMGLLYTPLIYDYVRRNKMGTYGAGAGIINRVAAIITLNGVGIFVWLYAVLFQPPAGEMTRVVLQQEIDRRDLLGVLSDGGSLHPQALSARVWQANGVTAPAGRTWEIRQRDRDSEDLAAERTRLEAVASSREAGGKSPPSDAPVIRLAEITATLEARAAEFRARVITRLGGRLLVEGDQLLAAHARRGVSLVLAATRRPGEASLDAMLGDLQRPDPAFIDLRPVLREGRFGLAASVWIEDGADLEATLARLRAAVTRTVQKRAPGLLASDAPELNRETGTALSLDLLTVEEPVETYVSPVTRLFAAVLGRLNPFARPAHRLTSLARDLRRESGVDQLRVEKGHAPRSLAVTALLPGNAPGAPTLDDPLGRRLQTLLGASADAALARQARTFYDRIESAAAAQHLTVARPVLAAAYAPMRYDYMSGYLWMFVMGVAGIMCTVVFARMERRGVVRKYGVEEAAAA